MGIAPHQHVTAAMAGGDSHEESTPSRSPSPVAAEQRAHSMPAATSAVAQLGPAGVSAQTGQSVSPNRRMGMLRGGLVAGAYVDGRQVTTGSQELPAHVGYGFDAEERFNRAAAARKSEASRFPAAMTSAKVDSSSTRNGSAPATARLIITSGGGRPSSGRDSSALHAGMGDSNQPRQAQHAEQTRTFSLVHAPVQNTDHSTESEAHHGRQSAAQLQSLPTGSLPMKEGATLPATFYQHSSQQHAQQGQSVVGSTLAQPEKSKQLQDYISSIGSSSRVDSLSGWASTSQPPQTQSSAQNNAADA